MYSFNPSPSTPSSFLGEDAYQLPATNRLTTGVGHDQAEEGDDVDVMANHAASGAEIDNIMRNHEHRRQLLEMQRLRSTAPGQLQRPDIPLTPKQQQMEKQLQEQESRLIEQMRDQDLAQRQQILQFVQQQMQRQFPLASTLFPGYIQHPVVQSQFVQQSQPQVVPSSNLGVSATPAPTPAPASTYVMNGSPYASASPLVVSPSSPVSSSGGMGRELLSGGVGLALGLGLTGLSSGIGAFLGSALGGYGGYGGYGGFSGFGGYGGYGGFAPCGGFGSMFDHGWNHFCPSYFW